MIPLVFATVVSKNKAHVYYLNCRLKSLNPPCYIIYDSIAVCREIALLNAQTKPLLKRDVEFRERYPNVYDAVAEAKQGAAYVGGSKVSHRCH